MAAIDYIKDFREGLMAIKELAAERGDLDADPMNRSPVDAAAHVDGLIYQEAALLLELLPQLSLFVLTGGDD